MNALQQIKMIKKYLKQGLISLVTAVITTFVVFGGYTFAQEYGFENSVGLYGSGFYEIRAEYHDSQDDFFDDKIGKLHKLMRDNPNFASDEDFLAPAENEECGENNVSTFCVAEGSLNRYIRYLEVLDGITGNIFGNEFEATQLDTIENVSVRNQDMANEIEEAKKIMKATIAAYNELRFAYPLHKKYQKITKTLMKYRIALKDVRQYVMRFPGKFVDATSVTCP